jgi:hypothetical protein
MLQCVCRHGRLSASLGTLRLPWAPPFLGCPNKYRLPGAVGSQRNSGHLTGENHLREQAVR